LDRFVLVNIKGFDGLHLHSLQLQESQKDSLT